jgi:hypothetical protein
MKMKLVFSLLFQSGPGITLHKGESDFLTRVKLNKDFRPLFCLPSLGFNGRGEREERKVSRLMG